VAVVLAKASNRVKSARPIFILIFLLSAVFALAAAIQSRGVAWAGRAQADTALKMLLGDSRRMFANHFFVKADVSFHSGYYPSIFDQARQSEEDEKAVARRQNDHDDHADEAHEKAMSFLGQPTDWIDRFGRHFRVTEHTHLEAQGTREILPWLRISAELDPHRIETYTVASYWLRNTLGKVDEAEQFLREGLQANPDSYELLFELGSLLYENRHDVSRARNVWETAVRRWHRTEDHQKEPDFQSLHDMATCLGHLEEAEHNYAKAIAWLEIAKEHAPRPEAVQGQIDELRRKMNAS
jgi:tetratricopeptide (TPR) repeat protein